MASLTLAEEGIETLFGTQDENLRRIERAFQVTLAARGAELKITGADPERVARAERFMAEMSSLLERGVASLERAVGTALPRTPLHEDSTP